MELTPWKTDRSDRKKHVPENNIEPLNQRNPEAWTERSC